MSLSYLEKIYIDPKNRIPIYKQLANQIIRGIELKWVGCDDALPSLHELHVTLDVSRGTVEKAYRLLMEKGIVEAIHGKGFYVNLPQRAYSNNKE